MPDLGACPVSPSMPTNTPIETETPELTPAQAKERYQEIATRDSEIVRRISDLGQLFLKYRNSTSAKGRKAYAAALDEHGRLTEEKRTLETERLSIKAIAARFAIKAERAFPLPPGGDDASSQA